MGVLGLKRARRYLMPTVEPYGGRGWVLACLAPPSALSLFATVLLKFEGAQRGVTWAALGQAVTPQYEFSAVTILRMLALDVALYAALAWYLDKVWHFALKLRTRKPTSYK